MKIERLLLTVQLKADAPISIRSGLSAEQQKAAPFARDHRNRPYVPATTLKGALRSQYHGEHATELFGLISIKDAGTSGAISFDHAFVAEEAAPETIKTSRRTAIDRRRGSAEHNKLFVTDSVGAGMIFSTQFAIGVENGEFQKAAERLAEALVPLQHGISVGAGQRQGQGLLTVSGKQLTVRRLCRQTWQFTEASDDELLQFITDCMAKAEPSKPLWTQCLKLAADQEFISIDSEAQAPAGEDDRIQIRMAKDDDDSPLLPPTSVIGALRSRAAWLAELAWLRGKGSTEFVPAARDFDVDSADCRERSLPTAQGPGELSSVERLFGVSGWAGLLHVALRPSYRGSKRQRANTAIDRFSGGALRGALFHTEVSSLPTWDLTLSIIASPARQAAWSPWRDTDIKFLELLIDDLQHDGFSLGHGASKGFGWMTVTPIEGAAHGR